MAKYKVVKEEVEEETTKKKKKKKNKEYVEPKFYMSPEAKKGIWTVVVVLIVLFITYLIAAMATRKEKEPEVEDDGSTVQYTEILAGSSFNKGEEDYYVVYYDMSLEDDEDMDDVSEGVSLYQSMPDAVTMYSCNLGSPFNKYALTGGDANTNPTNAEELHLKNPTIIKYSKGTVVEYIDGIDAVKAFLDEKNNPNTEETVEEVEETEEVEAE